MRPSTAMEIDTETGNNTNNGRVPKKAGQARGANAQPLGQKAVNTQHRAQQQGGGNETLPQRQAAPYMRRATPGIPPPPFRLRVTTPLMSTPSANMRRTFLFQEFNPSLAQPQPLALHKLVYKGMHKWLDSSILDTDDY